MVPNRGNWVGPIRGNSAAAEESVSATLDCDSDTEQTAASERAQIVAERAMLFDVAVIGVNRILVLL